MHTEATRRAVPARRRTQSTSETSDAAARTPLPPAITSVSTGASAGGRGAATRPSPEEVATLIPPGPMTTGPMTTGR